MTDRLPRPPAARPGRDLLLVVLGGTLGTGVRAVLSAAFPAADGVPVAVLAIDLVGAFVLGVLLEGLLRRGPDTGARRGARLLLGTGVLGGFTTYSALAVGTADLLATGRPLLGAGYGLGTVALGAAATAGGVALGRLVPLMSGRRA